MDAKNNGSKNLWNFLFTILYLALVATAIYLLDKNGHLRHEMLVFDFVVLALATFRLTRLFVYDSITGYVRDYFGGFSSGPGKTLSDLVNCPWCTGIWMALAVFVLYFTNPLFWYLLLILALAGAGTFIQITVWKVGRED